MGDIPAEKVGGQVQVDSGRGNHEGSLAAKTTHEEP